MRRGRFNPFRASAGASAPAREPRSIGSALLVLCGLMWCAPSLGAAELQGPILIHSDILGYDLRYWIYLPEPRPQELPELYFTDGQDFLAAGGMAELLDAEIGAGRVAPLAAVFLDSRDPAEPAENRRDEQFMCNADFANFFLRELMPAVSITFTGATDSTRRGLAGISFGAINAACFGVMMPDVFRVLILHSPGSEQHIEVVRELYEDRPLAASAFLITHGGRLDNAGAARRLVRTLERKGYPVRHLENRGLHNWEAWRPLLVEGLRAFAGLSGGDRVDE